MTLEWFRPRRYKHFDRPVCESFAEKVKSSSFVVAHPFSPLIHYMKESRRYKPGEHKTVTKSRPIMYASHRDACVLSYYAAQIQESLEARYAARGLGNSVIAYRRLGKSNFDFAADVYRQALADAPCAILAFDVSKFFDTLDHGLLKQRLKKVLNVPTLSEDWYRVLKFVTKYHYVDLTALQAIPEFAAALGAKGTAPIASIREVVGAGVEVHGNPEGVIGIPQGTPISAVLSNLYMLDFDLAAKAYCDSMGAMYRRYSDDIVIVCPVERAGETEAEIGRLMANEKLQLSVEKTERTLFYPSGAGVAGRRSAQYLGFAMSPSGASIRPSSLSRQWRKMRRSVRRAKRAAVLRSAAGQGGKVYAKKLRRRFSPLQFRNFSSYARRSARAFGGEQAIYREIQRLERAFEAELRGLSLLSQ